MKLLFRVLLLLLPLFVLPGCDKDDDPLKDKLRFKVTLRVTGENLAGLGAEMDYTSVRNTLTDPKPGPTGRDTYALRADGTYDLGEFGFYDQLAATIAMRNVTCTARPPANSRLKLEILVNGVLYDRVELNGASPGTISCSQPYWLVTTSSDGDDWDD